MRKTTMMLAVAASTAFASQAALAYQAGDVYVRGSFEKADVTTDNVSDENAFYLSGGYLFHDKMGVELGVGESVEHDFGLAGNNLGTMDRMPVNLLVNYYPLGGIEEARVQPFAGLGVNYTRYSSIDEANAGDNIDIDDDYGVVGQVGVDLTLTSNLSATGYARWSDVDAEVDNNGNGIGKVKLDPVTVGAGLTYRF
ncbi:OmpW/AlkL family protein [Halomonas halodenitrificans]|uniref:OmpW/AlkL family protein n=1 Tax=Halomonas halodenitrificans TaxID=28252 RepID=UPI000482B29E|nr:OmpW family outer membrane protein [Halomonas halodenitrificans]